MIRHMFNLETNDASTALCRRPLGLIRMDWNNVNCEFCLALRCICDKPHPSTECPTHPTCQGDHAEDYKQLFIDLYKAAAACEPPEETQLAEVLDAFGSQFVAADADQAEDSEKMYLVCINCGEAFDSIQTAHDHGTADLSGMSGWCGDEGFNILPESEAF